MTSPREPFDTFPVWIREMRVVLGYVDLVERLGHLSSVDGVVRQRIDLVVRASLDAPYRSVAVQVFGQTREDRVDAALLLNTAVQVRIFSRLRLTAVATAAATTVLTASGL